MSQVFVLLSKAASQLLFYVLAKLSTQVNSQAIYPSKTSYFISRVDSPIFKSTHKKLVSLLTLAQDTITVECRKRNKFRSRTDHLCPIFRLYLANPMSEIRTYFLLAQTVLKQKLLKPLKSKTVQASRIRSDFGQKSVWKWDNFLFRFRTFIFRHSTVFVVLCKTILERCLNTIHIHICREQNVLS